MCRREIALVHRLDRRGAIDFVDLAAQQLDNPEVLLDKGGIWYAKEVC